jgi:hypothetical protein
VATFFVLFISDSEIFTDCKFELLDQVQNGSSSKPGG